MDPTENPPAKQEIVLKNGESWTEVNVRDFFAGIFAAMQSGDPFPINFDDVWQMAYTNRRNAIQAIKDMGFKDKYDFVYLTQVDTESDLLRNQQNPGGRRSENVMLSVQCAEHLIARKVDEFFEIYRLCRVACSQPKAVLPKEDHWLVLLDFARDSRLKQIEQEKINAEHSKQISDLRAEKDGRTGCRTIKGYCILRGLSYSKKICSQWGKRVTAYCKAKEIAIYKSDDEEFNEVNSYPIEVLDETFLYLGPRS